jgi:GTP pyrophosphokinase
VPIDYRIQNGDRIEVLTSQNSKGPSRDWLNLVKSTQAKNKINQWFRSEFKESNINKGKDMISQYCKLKSINHSDIMKTEYQEKVMKKYGFRDWDSILAAIGHGGLREGQVVNRLLEEYEKVNRKNITDEQVLESISGNKDQKMKLSKSRGGIVVQGIDDMAVRFSRCCNPVPGDEIVGFVTRGRGVSIHRTDCVNVIHMNEAERMRMIEAEWQGFATGSGEKYATEITIYANNRTGLLVDLSKVFTERGIDLTGINSRLSKQGTATLSVSFEISGTEELNRIIEKIRQVDSIIDIERAAT